MSGSGGRVPPNDLAAERAVLGGILLENAALDVVSEASLTAGDFYGDAHARIYEAMVALDAEGQPVDGVTLRERLATAGKLAAAGGDDYILGLTETIPTLDHIGAHAQIVHEKAVIRGLITACHEVAARGYGDYGTAREFLDEAAGTLTKACEDRATAGQLHHIRDVVQGVFEGISERADAKGGPVGAPTGYEDLDRYISGVEPGLLYVLAGRPGMGKTALALNIVRNVAESEGKPAIFFSIEMPRRQVGDRLISSEALVDGGKLRSARLSGDDWKRLAGASGKLSELPIYIDDTSNHDVDDICRISRRKHREEGLSMVCVDYMQLASSGKRHDNREQEISYISRTLKGLAKDLEIPVMALSQLNRSLESRKDRRPQISDLRESGAIEQDADTILFIYRDEVYNADSPDRGLAEIIIGKQRAGPTGSFKAVFRKEFTKFEGYEGEQRDEPQFEGHDPTQGRY